MMRKRAVGTALVAGLLAVSGVQAYDLPLGLNLGFTSFLDGPPPAGPGLYYQQYVQYLTADQFNGPDGNSLLPPGIEPDLDAIISLSQVLYMKPVPKCPLGSMAGIDVILPYASIDLDYNTGPAGLPSANAAGLGDLLVGPFLQWNIVKDGKPCFFHRVEAQMIFPTGDYDDTRQLNPGANVFSFNPYWAGTYFFTPQLTASTRIHYLWNDANDDPAPRPTNPMPDEVEPGQAVHANFAAAYGINKMLRLGVNGYYLQQLGDTEVDGVEEQNTEEMALAVGPGALLSFSEHTHLFLNAYFETDVENRPESDRYNVRLVHHF